MQNISVSRRELVLSTCPHPWRAGRQPDVDGALFSAQVYGTQMKTLLERTVLQPEPLVPR